MNLCSHPAYALFSYNLHSYRRFEFDVQLLFIDLDERFFVSLSCFYSEVLLAWKFSGARIQTTSCINHVFNVPLNYTPLLSRSVDGFLVFPARLFACGIKLVQHTINLTDGSWKYADDFITHAILRFPSRRLLDLELARLHLALSATFPELFSASGLRRSVVPLLSDISLPRPFIVKTSDNIDMLTIPSKKLYCIFNRSTNSLPTTSHTHWHDVDALSLSSRINWTEVYQLPSAKKDGDVQYKLLHNVLPSLAVLHHLNPDIPSSCGWCGEKGTITHLFIRCPLIQPSLDLLHRLIACLLPTVKIDFELYWALVPHARGRCREAVRLSNFLIIGLKSTLYWLYRKCCFYDPISFWVLRIKSKILLEYEFYKLHNNLVAFNKRWSCNDAIFLVNGDGFTWLI